MSLYKYIIIITYLFIYLFIYLLLLVETELLVLYAMLSDRDISLSTLSKIYSKMLIVVL